MKEGVGYSLAVGEVALKLLLEDTRRYIYTNFKHHMLNQGVIHSIKILWEDENIWPS